MAEVSLDQLSGDLKVTPGVARPDNLVSTRPDWINQLTLGKAATALPGLLASLFNLCGHAHRLCAGLAVQAADGGVVPLADATRHALRTETLREHLRRIGLDWPRQLATGSEACGRSQELALKALQTCPLSLGAQAPARSQDFSGLPHWLGQQLLGMPAEQWLEGWERAPRPWMDDWCEVTPGWLPELLQGAKVVADGHMTGAPALRLHAARQDLMAMAGHLRDTHSFARQPYWRSQCAETGTWTRLNQEAPEGFDTPWLRLGARLAELVRLSLPDGARRSGAQWLQAGSVCIGDHEGLAWVEMARGLLIHYVRLDGQGSDARIGTCRVLAPTEWNFHPHGAVAEVLETLPKVITPDVEQRILALMAAFDPCVKFDLRSATLPTEVCHA